MKDIVIQSNIKLCQLDELDEQERKLVEMAKKATENSYSPYSNFAVGAALTRGHRCQPGKRCFPCRIVRRAGRHLRRSVTISRPAHRRHSHCGAQQQGFYGRACQPMRVVPASDDRDGATLFLPYQNISLRYGRHLCHREHT